MRNLLILAVVPLGGCLIPFFLGPRCGSGECPEPMPVEQGLYLVENGDPLLDDGTVEVGDDVVVLSWLDAEGNRWEAEYEVTRRFPE